ncbi:MAG: hypothetical protein ACFFDT_12370 [Candidatus Hodarchaeota archaeon]
MAVFEGIWLISRDEKSDSFLSRCFATPFKSDNPINTTVLLGLLRLLHEITGQQVQTITLTESTLHIRSLKAIKVILSCKNATNTQIDKFIYSLGSSLSTAGVLDSETVFNPENDSKLFRIDRLFEEALEQAIINANFDIPNTIQPIFTPEHNTGLLGAVRQNVMGAAIREQLNRSILIIQNSLKYSSDVEVSSR